MANRAFTTRPLRLALAAIAAMLVPGGATLVSGVSGQPDAALAQAAEDGPRDTLDFTLPDLDGNSVKLSHWRGHPVIVDFWATWCGPCRRQVPELQDLYSRYRKSRGLVVVGISCDTIQGAGVQAVQPFLDQFQVDYPILLATQSVLDNLGVEAIPTTLFLASDGRVVSRIVGAGRPGELTQSTRALLDGSKGGSRHGAPAPKRVPNQPEDSHTIEISWPVR